MTRQDVRKVSMLGRGQFSKIFMVIHGESRQQWALKCLDNSRIHSSKEFVCAAVDLAMEADVLSRLDHSNIIKLRGASDKCMSASNSVHLAASAVTTPDRNNSTGGIIKTAPGRTSDSPGTTDRDGSGHFILVDMLQETLQDRLRRWRNDPKSFQSLRNAQRRRSWIPRLSLSSTSIRTRRTSSGGRAGFTLGTSSRQSRNEQRFLSLVKMYNRIETVAVPVARAMKYIHDQGLVLKDLKPANIGFDENGDAQLFDFGMARPVEDCRQGETHGTPRYMAPEIMLREEPCSFASDVYSFGVVLFELCSLEVPFDELLRTLTGSKKTKKKANNNSRSSKEKEISIVDVVARMASRPSLDSITCPWTRALIEECWAQDPKRRPDFDLICDQLDEIMANSSSSKTATSITSISEHITTHDRSVPAGSSTSRRTSSSPFIVSNKARQRQKADGLAASWHVGVVPSTASGHARIRRKSVNDSDTRSPAASSNNQRQQKRKGLFSRHASSGSTRSTVWSFSETSGSVAGGDAYTDAMDELKSFEDGEAVSIENNDGVVGGLLQ